MQNILENLQKLESLIWLYQRILRRRHFPDFYAIVNKSPEVHRRMIRRIEHQRLQVELTLFIHFIVAFKAIQVEELSNRFRQISGPNTVTPNREGQ